MGQTQCGDTPTSGNPVFFFLLTERIPMNRFIFNIVSHTFLCMFASLHTEASDIILVEDGKSLQQIVMPSDRTSSQSEKSLLLAEGGKAFQKIVISANASNDIKTTAAYLAEKLEKISGAKFEIENGDGSNGIVLGTMADFPVEALKRPLEIRPVLKDVDIRNGLEAYGIRTEEKRLLLLGGGEPGVSHAVARFLELLGYRRFYPDWSWAIARGRARSMSALPPAGRRPGNSFTKLKPSFRSCSTCTSMAWTTRSWKPS